jgi:PadR family transcriptional regulator, regulatory protein PadR
LLTEEKGAGRAPGSTYWLIAKNENGRVEVLTIGVGKGEQALPVFGHEEEAEMFLCLGGADDGWRVRESTAGELVSVLYGPCTNVGRVALAPLPEMLDEKTAGLMSLDRERLLSLVFGRGRPSRRHGSTREASLLKRDRALHKTKDKTNWEVRMRDGERKKHGGGARQVDGRDTTARPKNWLVAVTLLVLREQGACGYALMERMGVFGLGEINPGNLYRTLRQMDKEGLCKSEWETFEGGPACRMYSTTDAGSSYLDSWAESLGRCERMVDAFFSIYPEGPAADGNGGRDGDEGEEDGDGQIRLAPANLLPKRQKPREGP